MRQSHEAKSFLKLKRLAASFCLIAACSLLAACSNSPLHVQTSRPPRYFQEGVSVTAAVVYTRPWNEISANLSPGFENTPANALSRVLQSQSYSDFRLLNALGINLQAGADLGPRITTTDEATRNLNTATTGGVTQTTRDDTTQVVTTRRVDDNAPPDLPAAQSPVTARSAGDLPDQIGSTRTVATEPFFHYSAAAALYQEIALINDAVRGIPQYSNTRPYVIRLRVGVTAFRRDLPWDIYAHLSLFRTDGGHDPIVILPILSTDAYEGTLDASALQQLVDLRLSLQATAGNFRAGGGFNRLNDRLSTFLRRRYDSSLRISGVNGTSLDVKFGAARDNTGFALDDRDHYVTLIAYLPEPHVGDDYRYRFFMTQEARNVRTGQRVDFESDAFYSRTAPIVARFHLSDDLVLANQSIVRATRRNPSPDQSDSGSGETRTCRSTVGELLFYLANDVGVDGATAALSNFRNCMNSSSWGIIDSSANFLISSALTARSSDPTNSFEFHVRPSNVALGSTFPTALSPQVQNSERTTTVWVPYSGRLELDDVQALLVPIGAGGVNSLAPRAVSLRTLGAQSFVVLEFPAVASLALGSPTGRVARRFHSTQNWRVCVARTSEDLHRCAANAAARDDARFYNGALGLGYVNVLTPQGPQFTMTTPVQSVRLAADGTLSFSVNVAPAVGRPVKLTAIGAELMVGGAVVNDLSVTTAGLVPITLRNAVPGGVATIQGVSTAAEDPEARTVRQVSVAVQAAPAGK